MCTVHNWQKFQILGLHWKMPIKIVGRNAIKKLGNVFGAVLMAGVVIKEKKETDVMELLAEIRDIDVP